MTGLAVCDAALGPRVALDRESAAGGREASNRTLSRGHARVTPGVSTWVTAGGAQPADSSMTMAKIPWTIASPVSMRMTP